MDDNSKEREVKGGKFKVKKLEQQWVNFGELLRSMNWLGIFALATA